MRAEPRLGKIVDWLRRCISRGDDEDMVCGRCPRMASCGLPPSDDCIAKLQYREQHESAQRRRVAETILEGSHGR